MASTNGNGIPKPQQIGADLIAGDAELLDSTSCTGHFRLRAVSQRPNIRSAKGRYQNDLSDFVQQAGRIASR